MPETLLRQPKGAAHDLARRASQDRAQSCHMQSISKTTRHNRVTSKGSQKNQKFQDLFEFSSNEGLVIRATFFRKGRERSNIKHSQREPGHCPPHKGRMTAFPAGSAIK